MSCLNRRITMGGLMPSQCNDEKPVVTSIAEVNSKVIVTLSNGKYLEASMEVVDKNLNADIEVRNLLNKLTEDIQTLKDKEDKDTIFDPTELEQKINTLGSKITELTTQLTALTEFKDKVIAGLAEVQNFNGEVSFKAFTKETQL